MSDLMQAVFAPECDVVVVNYNAGDLLLPCVHSALACGAARVIVVDNHSADGSADSLAEEVAHGRVSLLRNDRNLGFATACNQGVALSTAEHILFLNPDCLLEPAALSRLQQVLLSAPEAGMAGGFLCNPDGSEQPGGRRVFPTPRRAFVRAFGLSFLAKVFPAMFSDFLLHKEPLPQAPVAVEAISGACMLVKRQAIEAVGGWDEGYFLHCEDLDWCMRFQQHGWRVMFVPDAKVMHVWGGVASIAPILWSGINIMACCVFTGNFFATSTPVFSGLPSGSRCGFVSF